MGRQSRSKRTPAAATPPRAVAARGGPPGLPLLLIGVVAAGCYLNALGGELVFDDLNAITRNPAVTGFDLRAIFTTPSWWGPTGGYARFYRPFATLTFALDHAAHGLAPFGFHAVNVLLHALVSMLLAATLARRLGAPRTGLLAGLLFATHPVHVEAVASVVGRAELLAALGALGAWWLVLRGGGLVRSVAAGVAVLGGTLAKESALTIVPVVVLADLLFERDRGVAAVVARRAAGWACLAGGVGLAVALRAAVVDVVPPAPDPLDNVLAGAPLGARLLTATKVVALYARTLLWPVHLSADYSYGQVPLVESAADPGFLAGLGVVLGLGVLGVWGWRRRPAVGLGVVLLAVPYALVANVLVVIGTLMAERLLYLPSAGFCLLAALGGEALGARLGDVRRAPWAIAGILAALWATRTWTRNPVWNDPLVFAEALVADAPASARSHRELGLVYSERGRHAEAIAALETARRIKPDDPMTLYNQGNVLLRAGRLDDAVAAYEASLRARPGEAGTINNLGNAHSARGDEIAAEAWFRKGLALHPEFADLHLNLANSLLRQGRAAEAEPHYREALRLAPDSALAHANYGVLLAGLGRPREAATSLRQAVARGAVSPPILVQLVAALDAAGARDEALRVQRDAARRFPGDPTIAAMGQRLEGR